MAPFITKANRVDLLVLKDLIEADKVSPVIDRIYTLTELPEAIRSVSWFPTGCRSRIATTRLIDDAGHRRSVPSASPAFRLARFR
jgi:hypothetical protein